MKYGELKVISIISFSAYVYNLWFLEEKKETATKKPNSEDPLDNLLENENEGLSKTISCYPHLCKKIYF